MQRPANGAGRQGWLSGPRLTDAPRWTAGYSRSGRSQKLASATARRADRTAWRLLLGGIAAHQNQTRRYCPGRNCKMPLMPNCGSSYHTGNSNTRQSVMPELTAGKDVPASGNAANTQSRPVVMTPRLDRRPQWTAATADQAGSQKGHDYCASGRRRVLRDLGRTSSAAKPSSDGISLPGPMANATMPTARSPRPTPTGPIRLPTCHCPAGNQNTPSLHR